MENDSELIGAKIKDLRLGRGLTQAQLAKRIGVARTTLTGYENGTIKQSTEVLMTISEYFGVTMNYLCGDVKVNNDVLDIYEELMNLQVKLFTSKHLTFKKSNVLDNEITFTRLQLECLINSLDTIINGEYVK